MPLTVEQLTVIRAGLDASAFKAGANLMSEAMRAAGQDADRLTESQDKVSRKILTSAESFQRFVNRIDATQKAVVDYTRVQELAARVVESGHAKDVEANAYLDIYRRNLGLLTKAEMDATAAIEQRAQAMQRQIVATREMNNLLVQSVRNNQSIPQSTAGSYNTPEGRVDQRREQRQNDIEAAFAAGDKELAAVERNTAALQAYEAQLATVNGLYARRIIDSEVMRDLLLEEAEATLRHALGVQTESESMAKAAENADRLRAKYIEGVSANQSLVASMQEISASTLSNTEKLTAYTVAFERHDAALAKVAGTAQNVAATQEAQRLKAEQLRAEYIEGAAATQRLDSALDEIAGSTLGETEKLTAMATALDRYQAAMAKVPGTVQAARAQQEAERKELADLLVSLDANSTALIRYQAEIERVERAEKLLGGANDVTSAARARATQKLNDSTNGPGDQATDWDKVRASIDGVYRASKQYEELWTNLQKLRESDRIGVERYNLLNDQLNASFAKQQKQIDGDVGAHFRLHTALQNLSVQSVDIIQGLATGQPVMTTFLQQGGQIVQLLLVQGNVIGTLKAGWAALFTPMGAGIATLIGIGSALAYVTAKAIEAANEIAKLGAVANAFGRGNQLSGGGLNKLVTDLQLQGVSRTEGGNAVADLARNLELSETQMRRVVQASGDFAAAVGSDAPTAVKTLSDVMIGNGEVIKQVDDKLRALSSSQRRQVQDLIDQGKGAEAANIAFEAFRQQTDNTREKSLGPFQKMLDEVSKAFVRAGEASRKTQIDNFQIEGQTFIEGGSAPFARRPPAAPGGRTQREGEEASIKAMTDEIERQQTAVDDLTVAYREQDRILAAEPGNREVVIATIQAERAAGRARLDDLAREELIRRQVTVVLRTQTDAMEQQSKAANLAIAQSILQEDLSRRQVGNVTAARLLAESAESNRQIGQFGEVRNPDLVTAQGKQAEAAQRAANTQQITQENQALEVQNRVLQVETGNRDEERAGLEAVIEARRLEIKESERAEFVGKRVAVVTAQITDALEKQAQASQLAADQSRLQQQLTENRTGSVTEAGILAVNAAINAQIGLYGRVRNQNAVVAAGQAAETAQRAANAKQILAENDALNINLKVLQVAPGLRDQEREKLQATLDYRRLEIKNLTEEEYIRGRVNLKIQETTDKYNQELRALQDQTRETRIERDLDTARTGDPERAGILGRVREEDRQRREYNLQPSQPVPRPDLVNAAGQAAVEQALTATNKAVITQNEQLEINRKVLERAVPEREAYRVQLTAEIEARKMGLKDEYADMYVQDKVNDVKKTATDAAKQHTDQLTREATGNRQAAAAALTSEAAVLRQKAAMEATEAAATKAGVSVATLTRALINQRAAQAALQAGEENLAQQRQLENLQKIVATVGSAALYEQTLQNKIDDATRSLKAQREVATDPAIQQQLDKEIARREDLIRKIDGATNAEKNRRQSNANEFEARDIEKQIKLVGTRSDIADRELAQFRERERLVRDQNADPNNLTDDQQKLIDQAGQLSTAQNQLKQYQNSVNDFTNSISSSFDNVASSITEALVQGQGAAINWKGIMQGVANEVLKTFLKLAILNPLLNQIFGGNRGTLGSLFEGLNGSGSLGSLTPGSQTVSGGEGMGGGAAAGWIGKALGWAGGLLGLGGAGSGLGAAGSAASIFSTLGSNITPTTSYGAEGGYTSYGDRIPGNVLLGSPDFVSTGSLSSTAGGNVTGIYHSGGLVGMPPSAVRWLDSSVFDTAARFHSGTGLGSDEFAAILQRGERVLTAQQNASASTIMSRFAANDSHAGGPAPVIQFNITTPNADSFRQSQTQIMGQASQALLQTRRRLGQR